jgi:hypothetical protein
MMNPAGIAQICYLQLEVFRQLLALVELNPNAKLRSLYFSSSLILKMSLRVRD